MINVIHLLTQVYRHSYLSKRILLTRETSFNIRRVDKTLGMELQDFHINFIYAILSAACIAFFSLLLNCIRIIVHVTRLYNMLRALVFCTDSNAA